MGSQYLATRLNELLLGHVRTRLPELQSKVHTALTSARSELSDFGDKRLQGASNNGALVLQLIHGHLVSYGRLLCGGLELGRERIKPALDAYLHPGRL